MWMFSARAWALTRTFGELIVQKRHPMCQCQGGDQETREIRGTIKFIKGFWEEMSRSLPDRRSGADWRETVWRPDQIKSCDVLWGSCSRVWLRGCSWMTDSSWSCSKWLRWKTSSLKFENTNGPPLPSRHVVVEHLKRGTSTLFVKVKPLNQVVFASRFLMLTYKAAVLDFCIFFLKIIIFIFWFLFFIPPSNSAHANLLSMNQANWNHYVPINDAKSKLLLVFPLVSWLLQ